MTYFYVKGPSTPRVKKINMVYFYVCGEDLLGPHAPLTVRAALKPGVAVFIIIVEVYCSGAAAAPRTVRVR